MKILVTGATGQIGSVVAEALTRAGHHVVGVARSDAAAAKLASQGLEGRRGDLADPDGLAALTDDVDAVVWAATGNQEAVDAPAVSAMLDRMAGSGKTFLYTSGIWVHGDTGGAVVDEDAPLAPTPLVAWRPAVERKVLATPGIRAIVVRPGIVYGRGAGIPAMLVGMAREGGVARTIGDGQNRWPVVHVDDLADLYRLAVEAAAAGTVLLGVGGPSVRQADVVAAIGEALGVGVGAWPLDEARGALGPFADALALDQQVRADRALALGWRPSGPSLLDDLRRGSYRG